MKIRKRNRRNLVALLLALLMTATTLIGCSSATEPTKETKETEAVAVKEEKVKVAEVKEAEPTPEPTPEIKEVDTESTLPGKEWILKTFPDIIDTPKLVIFNDTTNKKVILEEGQEVEFCKDDVLAIYIPKGTGEVKELDFDIFKEAERKDVVTLKNVVTIKWVEGTATTKNVVEFNGEEITLTAKLIFVE